MKFFVNLLNPRAVGFWIVWTLLSPIVFVRFLFSDLINLRFRYWTAWIKTGLVRMSVYDQMVKTKR
ncbi:hypothetical protein [Dyadobacter sp. CY343]|uniref:hypothetical protein n=1 Tax=Dyadobacter sp. CY343 TaxID=2907299 RepID=UPI001F25481A|nr:hypothetical protein [Dyadobacter sp. CY343]MCE7061251.1 hypothetical protein [Dyadobacter sp. CY343]